MYGLPPAFFCVPFFRRSRTCKFKFKWSSGYSHLPRLLVCMAPSPRRTIGVWQLAAMGYLAVCAGPFGIEDAVGAAGALPTLLGIVVLALTWGLSQGLMAAELSNIPDMCESNGGYVLWVHRILGPFWGWMNAWNSAICNIFDLPLYPVMFACYVEDSITAMGGSAHAPGLLATWGLKAGALAVVVCLNLGGRGEVLGSVSVLMTVMMLAPFLLEVPFTMALWAQRPQGSEDWSNHLRLHGVWPTTAYTSCDPGAGNCPAPRPLLSSSYASTSSSASTPSSPPGLHPARTIDWATFVSTLVWCFSGWDTLGSFADEVRRPQWTYPVGILLCLVLVTLNYMVPIMVGLVVFPDTHRWSSASCGEGAGTTAEDVGVGAGGSMGANGATGGATGGAVGGAMGAMGAMGAGMAGTGSAAAAAAAAAAAV